MPTTSDVARQPNKVDLASHDFFVDEVPLWAFQELRERDPVHWQPETNPNHGFWAVTRHRDIEEILRDTRTFSSARGITLEEQNPEEIDARRSMIDMDPPGHTRLRRLVSKLFIRTAVAQCEGFVREQARMVLDRALPRREFDFVEEISRQLPIRVLARIMGVPNADLPMCIELGDAMIAQTDPEYSRGVIDKEDTSEYRLLPFRSPAANELTAYGHRLAAERRREPRDDLITNLVQAEVDGEHLSEQEFDNFFCLLIVAGNETTRHAITHGMLAFTEHRDQWDRLMKDPGLMALAVEEILRWGSVTMHFRRTATRDLEIRVMFEELLPRLLDLEVSGPIARLRSNFINGIKHMPVRVELTVAD
jgi:cytochrome P450